jgi:hypothetical protein
VSKVGVWPLTVNDWLIVSGQPPKAGQARYLVIRGLIVSTLTTEQNARTSILPFDRLN